MATNIGTAFFNVTFNTAAARREVTALVSTVNRSFGLLSGVAIVGTTALVAGLVRTTAELGAASLTAANEFEQAFADVRKTLDEGDLSARAAANTFETLSNQLRDLALGTPLDLEDDITQVAALGAQLGIATEDIRDFTEIITEVGVTTNIAVEDAATGFARLANIMGLTSDDFRDLGDSLINLGNNLPAQEDEILRFSLRIAAAGEIVGFTSDEVLALSGALASVGVPAERGGTAMQRTMIKIEEAVAGGTEAVALFAQVSGLSAEQFIQLWETDAAEAFTLFVEGLGRSGSQAFGILSNLELAEQRTLQALLSIANAGPLLRDSFALGADAAGSLARESGIFFDTTEARLTILKNTIHDVGITIGDELQGPFREIIDSVIRWIDENPELIDQLADGLASALTTLGDLLAENLPLLEDLVFVLPELAEEALSVIGVFADLTRVFVDVAGAWLTFKNAIDAGEGFLPDAAEVFSNSASKNIDFITNKLDELAIKAQEWQNFDFDSAGGLQKFLNIFPPTAVLSRIAIAVGQLGDETQGLIDLINDDLNADLAAGVSPIRAVSDALLEFQQRLEPLGGELGALEFQAFVADLGLTNDELVGVVQRMQDLGAEISPVILEMLGLRNVTDSWMNLLSQGVGGAFDVGEIFGLEDIDLEAEAAAAALQELNDAAASIRDGFTDMGMTSSEFLDNINLLNPEVATFLRELGNGRQNIGRAKLEVVLLEQALTGLRIAMEKPASDALFGLGDVVNGIEQVTRTIKSSGDQVLLHGEEFSAQVIENLNKIAEFEANLTILFAQGFDDLARELAERGPEFAHIAEDFVKGFADPAVIEEVLENGGVISDELSGAVDEALRASNNDPALLEFVSQFGSQSVLSKVYLAGKEYGDQYGSGIVAGLQPYEKTLEALLGEFIPDIPPFGAPPGNDGIFNNEPPPPPPLPPGVGTTGGGNVINMSFSPGTPVSEAARAGQLINSLVAT